MRRLWLIAAVTVPLAGVPGRARADCEDGIGALAARVAALTDARLRTLLQLDLRKAQRELWEFDEVECAVVLDHAERLLKTGS